MMTVAPLVATLLASQSAKLMAWLEGQGGPFRWTILAAPGKAWWRAIGEATQAKVARNLRRGRPLA